MPKGFLTGLVNFAIAKRFRSSSYSPTEVMYGEKSIPLETSCDSYSQAEVEPVIVE